MKKSFFFATMLLSIATFAQQRTFVKSVSTNYAAKQVTFNISWAAGSRGAVGANTYNSKVWVLVDYQEVQNGVAVGSWKRANVLLSSLPAGCTADGTNTKGFWYQGQATAAQNTTITVKLSSVPDKFNWCAFVSDCPPKVAASSNGSYTFAGTPPFTLTAANGATQQVNGTTLAHSALTIIPTSLTDETNCPGIFCPYTGNDLYVDATHICRQRTSGARNWETWIKDTRDSELYRVVLMPDNKWWLAQDVRLASYGGTSVGSASVRSVCANVAAKCGRIYSAAETKAAWGGTSGVGSGIQGVCPPGWKLPLHTEYETLIQAIAPTTFIAYECGRYAVNTTVTGRLQSLDSGCNGGNDYYGWASVTGSGQIPNYYPQYEAWGVNRPDNTMNSLYVNHRNCTGGTCGYLTLNSDREVHRLPVRCYK